MSKKNIVCLHDRIMMELPTISETTTEAGVIIPESVNAEEEQKKLSQEEGKLVAIATFVGPEVKTVKVGDLLELDNASVPIITIEGVRYAVAREYNVICIVK